MCSLGQRSQLLLKLIKVKRRLECQTEESGKFKVCKWGVKIQARKRSTIPWDYQGNKKTYRLIWTYVQPPKREIWLG